VVVEVASVRDNRRMGAWAWVVEDRLWTKGVPFPKTTRKIVLFEGKIIILSNLWCT